MDRFGKKNTAVSNCPPSTHPPHSSHKFHSTRREGSQGSYCHSNESPFGDQGGSTYPCVSRPWHDRSFGNRVQRTSNRHNTYIRVNAVGSSFMSTHQRQDETRNKTKNADRPATHPPTHPYTHPPTHRRIESELPMQRAQRN